MPIKVSVYFRVKIEGDIHYVYERLYLSTKYKIRQYYHK